MDTSSNAREGESQISIDIEDLDARLATSVQEMIRSFHPIHDDRSIFRAPTRLRTVNKKMYTPQNVSLGPLHHGKEKLATMERQKLGYLEAFTNRSKMSLEACISVTKKHKDRARNCYAKELELGDDEFVKILLVDSCFIIEVICRGTASDVEMQTDYLSSPELIYAVVTDMILLENQIPFFLLDDLYSIAFKDNKFLKLSMAYFSELMLAEDFGKRRCNEVEQIYQDLKPKHFLDLLRTCHLPATPRRQLPKGTGLFVPIRSAAELKEAGIHFKKGSSDCLLDIKYTKGVLEIPQIKTDDRTEIVLRNLIALEQCLYPFDTYVIDYIYFMDVLIDSSKDVDLLKKNRIIESGLSDNSAVAALFNNTAMQCALWTPHYYFHSVSVDLNEYYKQPWHRWKATFKRDYCSTPWMIASTVAAIILLARKLEEIYPSSLVVRYLQQLSCFHCAQITVLEPESVVG
ncbi:hypothetical protein RJ640_014150 [Escallonia rubra]|uniref:Uncharacterized protein n=1 Tax=Escallonia rubra TaxID=112253 RepID=A0AA88RMT6_9ASTE|nr:hypothetical protein RJ640_014150 [Escallonia rubra]